ncbi:hypothetical protein E4T56_gene18556 [Termitomyces sp. T112]|nr:hypothetical protein E4T56_gene18556 [Termitomyces sp. T112]
MHLYNARVPKDIGANVFDNPIVQLALAQVLNKLDIVGNQRDEASFPPQLPKAKKAHTKPSVFFEGALTQRAPLVPYDDIPAGDDQLMEKHPDFRMPQFTAGSSRLAPAKAGLSRPATAKAGSTEPATIKVQADNSAVLTTPLAFSTNVPQGSEAGVIEVLESRTYTFPTALSHKNIKLVHQDPCDKEFFIIQMQASQAATRTATITSRGYNGWYVPTADNQEHFHVLLQIHKSQGQWPLQAAKWLCYGEAALFTHLLQHSVEAVNIALAALEGPSTVAPQLAPEGTEEPFFLVLQSNVPEMEEPFSLAPLLSTSITMAGLSAPVVLATPSLTATSSASSKNASLEEFMELDDTNSASVLTGVCLKTTSTIVSGPLDTTIVTNIATTVVPKAGISSSSGMANTISEH